MDRPSDAPPESPAEPPPDGGSAADPGSGPGAALDPGASPAATGPDRPAGDALDRVLDGLRPSTVRSRDDAAPAPPSAPPTWPEDGERRGLPTRAVEAHRIAAAIFAVPLALGLGTLSVLAATGVILQDAPAAVAAPVPGLVAILLLVRAVAWPPLSHRHRAWRLTPEVLDIWEGVIWRRVISVPRSRVQHTEVGRGPIQRGYDLASLSIHTAGEEHAEVTLRGLETATAEAIRDCLLNREEDHVV